MKKLISFSLFTLIIVLMGAFRSVEAQRFVARPHRAVVAVRPIYARGMIYPPPVYRGPYIRAAYRPFYGRPYVRPAYFRPGIRVRVW